MMLFRKREKKTNNSKVEEIRIPSQEIMQENIIISDYMDWNFEKDYIHTDEKKLLNLTNDDLHNFGSRAYVFNTAKGLYYNKFDSLNGRTDDIYLFDGKDNMLIFKNAVIVGTLVNKHFIIIYNAENGFDYLIDTRGEIYTLNQNEKGLLVSPAFYKITKDVKSGIYLIERRDPTKEAYKIPYLTSDARNVHLAKLAPSDNLTINKNFKEFIKSNKGDNSKYFYLTLDNSKRGSLSKYIADRIGSYEVIPNIFEDDETLNIRIKATEELVRSRNREVDFLESKYLTLQSNCMYNLPIEKYIYALDISIDKIREYQPSAMYPPSDSERPMLIQINNTLKSILKIDDDNSLYSRLYRAFIKLINYHSIESYKSEENYFEQFRFPWPTLDTSLNRKYLTDRIDLLNQISAEKITTKQIKRMSDEEVGLLLKEGYHSSKEVFKKETLKYETEVIEELISSGIYMPKWKSESQLFVLIRKYYEDAIFQYRTDWLGKQSIDIYIPSLNVGIEYQGQQHFYPIDFFGGEEAFIECQKRDKLKKVLCQTNGVELVYWKYDETINKANLAKKMRAINKSI